MSIDSHGHNHSGWFFPAVVAATGWAYRRIFSARAIAASTPHPSSQSVAVADSISSQAPHTGTAAAIAPRYALDGQPREQVPGGRLSAIIAAGSLLLGVFAGVAFLYIYWTSDNNGWLGGTLALSLGFTGAGLILWSHWLVPRKEVTDPRPGLSSTTQEQHAFLQAFASGEHRIERRNLLKWMGAAIAATFAAITVSVLRSLAKPPGPALFNTVWVRGQRLVTIKGEPLLIDSLQPGSAITVFPENQLGSVNGQTVLIRVRPEFLDLPKGRAGWAPMGYVAYSRVCTHAGCPVGIFQSETDLLLCPCHQSTFNVLNGAQPTAGPAARPLPQLPLYADADGYLRAAGGFSEPPGPGFWSIP